MKTTTSVLFLALLGLLALAPPASAQIYYPWCAQYSGGGMGGGGTNCGFSTLAQCQATVSGIGGFCVRNSFYTGNGNGPVRHARKRHRD